MQRHLNIFFKIKKNNNFDIIKQLWYALAKTQSEQAAWALAMDRMLDMVSINAGLVLGPSVAQQNPRSTISYLKGESPIQISLLSILLIF